MNLQKYKRKIRVRKASLIDIQCSKEIASEDLFCLENIYLQRNEEIMERYDVEQAKSILTKNSLKFFQDIKKNINIREYDSIVAGMHITTREKNEKIVNFHCKTQNMFILLEGQATYEYSLSKKANSESITVDKVERGSLVSYSPFLQTNFHFYDVKCQTKCILFELRDENILRIVRRYLEKKTGEWAILLKRTSIFCQIPLIQLGSLVPFFIQNIYSKQNLNNIKQYIQFIVQGEIQICKVSNFSGMVRIVKLGFGESFSSKTTEGDRVIRIVSSQLKVLRINQKVFEILENMHFCIKNNNQKIEFQKKQVYSSLYEKNRKILKKSHIRVEKKDKKDKKFKKRKNKPKLEWWGLVGNAKIQKSALPSFYKKSHSVQSDSLESEGQAYLGAKIGSLKRKMIERELSQVCLFPEKNETFYEHSQFRKTASVKKRMRMLVRSRDKENRMNTLCNKVKNKLINYMKNETIEENIMF